MPTKSRQHRVVHMRRAVQRMRQVEAVCPRTTDDLHRLVTRALGLRMPRRAIVPGHDTPFDYLTHTFFEGRDTPTQDAVVWANRGGGKTMLGAVATLLDMLFKPGIQVRILGGSGAQSRRMFTYLLGLIDRPIARGVLRDEPTRDAITFVNGSRVEVLNQSQRSVRGVRVHKMRCDEVEEFKPDVWDAAQLVTRSQRLGPFDVRGAVEAVSTMHRPFGLMSKLIDRARRADGSGAKLFMWSALDVMERCPPARKCETCALWPSCQGRAKEAEGYLRIDDLIVQRRRTSDAVWNSEMLCRQPRRDENVFPSFDPAPGGAHVLPTSRDTLDAPDGAIIVGGMDFGLRSPLVMLWALLTPPNDPARHGDRTAWHLHVFDAHAQRGLTLDQHLAVIDERGWPRPVWIGVDPAGRQRNSQTGLTDIDLLRRAGYRVRSKAGPIVAGLERLRRRFDQRTISIDPRCTPLIESLATYHYDPVARDRETPVKDGPDHACDALRYLVMNWEVGGETCSASYF